MTANQMLMVAIGWQMYDITHRAWDLGLVGLFQFMPALLLTLPAGHLADKVKRSRIFSVCMLVQAAMGLLLYTAAQDGSTTRELVLFVSVILGTTRAFQMPAQQALVPLLVPQAMLSQAVAFASSTMQAAIICGPAIGGAIYVLGVEYVYFAGMSLLILAGYCMHRVRYTHIPSAAQTTLRTLFAGVEFLWCQKTLLGATTLDLFAVLLGGATALLPMFARDILNAGPFELGLLRAAPAAGALIISVYLFKYPLERRAGRWLFNSVSIFGLATIMFGLSQNLILSLVALAITGAADNISVVIRQTLIQVETPDEIRGRVSAVNSIFIGASNQLGEFESGITAEWFGPVGSVLLGGMGTVMIAALWYRGFPSLAKRDHLVAPHS